MTDHRQATDDRSRPARVLIIDDEDDWYAIMRRALKGHDYSIEWAGSYDEACELLGRSFDLSIMNIVLRGEKKPIWRMEWTDLLETARKRGTDVIVITALRKREIRRELQEYEVRAVLRKQRTGVRQLQSAVQHTLQERTMRQSSRATGEDRVKDKSNRLSSTVTWLHVSDFHFRSDRSWDTQIVLEQLLKDLEERVERIGPAVEKIDLAFVTGDLSFSGQPDQYLLANAFLKKLRSVTGVRKSRIFFVPGNHDVDRGAIHTLASRGLLVHRDAVNQVYHDIEARRAFLLRLSNYRDFVDREYRHIHLDENALYYVRHRTINGKVVRITGLNSAWTSFEDGEYGKLILGDAQVRQAVSAGKKRKKADVRIALLHHPLDWLEHFDREDCEAQLHGEYDFVLHGHMHKTGIMTLSEPDREAIIIGAGASYETRERANAYNYVCLNLEKKQGTVYLREYTDRRGGRWTSDTRTYDGVEGRHEFFW